MHGTCISLVFLRESSIDPLLFLFYISCCRKISTPWIDANRRSLPLKIRQLAPNFSPPSEFLRSLMAMGFSESPNDEPQNSFSYGSSSNSSSRSNNNNSNDAGDFECNICLELAQDPIVTLCGHLFCWPCLYQWLHVHANSSDCPVCKAIIEEEKLVPLYGRGKTSTDPRSKTMPGVNIPHRPTGQRPATAPQPPPQPNNFPQMNPWFMGGGAPLGANRFGNFTFSAAFGGLFPLLNFQVHGFPDASAYGPAAGFPYGYAHSFHGANAHGFPRQMHHGQQLDNYLKALLLVIGLLVVASLVW